MRVAFLKQGKELGLNRHLLALLDFFRNQGLEVEEFDLTEGGLQDTVNRLVEFSPLFTLDVNASGVIVGQRDEQRVPIFDAFGFVHVSLFTDEPLFYFPSLLDVVNSTNFLAVITDLKYADTLRLMGLDRGLFYITPFVDRKQMPEPSEEKDIELIFLGPVIDPQIIAQQITQVLKESFLPYFFEVGEFLFRNPEVHLLHASEYIFSMFNQSFQEEFIKWRQENPQEYFKLLNDLSVYATARKRWYILSFLEGINLRIVGGFQGELKEGHEHVEVQSWNEALELIGRSYMTLLSFPYAVPTGIGFTPIEVASMGSAPLIDYRATLPGFFMPDKEVITYLPLDRADIEEKVLFYLENLDRAREIGEKAREKVLQSFTPEDRAQFLYRLFQDILSQAQQKDQS
ncbi:MAG: glycosyltransferase family 1 protein [Acidobacteria bacterium]|jgi:glycosyltransferase involved in cell wall biosynthesis|nr:MAG: glycosyltransferase family 1 protein [Acidobacteriota bacterium]